MLPLLMPAAHAGTVCPPQHIDETSRVKYVYDGDTLQLEDGRKVRLMGIDTPEIFSKRRLIAGEIKASGEKAKAALQQQLKQVNQHIGLAFGVQRVDRYGRTLAHVFLPDGTNLQAWLISQGYAIAFTTPPNDRMSGCYQQQEIQARELKQGIWQLPQYQLKRTHQLDENSHGFHRLQGKVSRVEMAPHRYRFYLDDKVEINIYKNDRQNFNTHMLNNLQGKTFRIRGWLHNKKARDSHLKNGVSKSNLHKKQYLTMTLRHPNAMSEQKAK